ncbi:MAG TPA: complex I NDUFA9 subunit family protein [Thermohalobaculum sp.]|nr:complex I NDUFA9 subunit family protein [Thermohalobaculum sp.]
MPDPSPIVTVIGGSGFVGRYITQRLARGGWRVRVACRRPNEALFVRTYGVVGQVEPVQCNIRDEASLRAVIRGADAVVNCVGVLYEKGRNRFDAVQAEGAGCAARLAAEEGARRFVQISAIGADAGSESAYARTKAAGEAAVRDAFPDAVILRPSVVFGPGDGFFERFAAMARYIPFILPIVGGDTRFQPVWVVDVAEAAARAAEGAAAPGIYELGGPNIYTLREAVALTLRAAHRRRLVINLPFWLARLKASVLEWLPVPPLTVDQVKLLRRDNVVSQGAKTLADLGIEPTAAEGIVESYLVPFRPHGQYQRLEEGDGGAPA